MATRSLLAGALGLALLTAAFAGDATQDDTKKIQGTWVVKLASLQGKPVDKDIPAEVIFAGDKYTLKWTDGHLVKGTYKLDATKKPKALNLSPDKSQAGVVPRQAIYQFDGGLLKICVGTSELRPSLFSDEKNLLLVLERKGS